MKKPSNVTLDGTPLSQMTPAYKDGHYAGYHGEGVSNPYEKGTQEFLQWEEGWDAGNAEWWKDPC